MCLRCSPPCSTVPTCKPRKLRRIQGAGQFPASHPSYQINSAEPCTVPGVCHVTQPTLACPCYKLTSTEGLGMSPIYLTGTKQRPHLRYFPWTTAYLRIFFPPGMMSYQNYQSWMIKFGISLLNFRKPAHRCPLQTQIDHQTVLKRELRPQHPSKVHSQTMVQDDPINDPERREFRHIS